ADLRDADPPGVDLGEQRSALQRVVHDLPLGPHPDRVRGALGRAMSRSGAWPPGRGGCAGGGANSLARMYRTDIISDRWEGGLGVYEVLEFAILGVLHEAPMHGYELRKRLTARLGAFRAFSYGSLYPTLRRMQRAGWIVEQTEDTRRGGSWGRRARRVYQITAEGKERFAELIADAG